MGNPAFFHCNRRLAVVPAGGGTPRSLTEAFDEHAFLLDWKPDGIYFWGFKRPQRIFSAFIRTTTRSRA